MLARELNNASGAKSFSSIALHHDHSAINKDVHDLLKMILNQDTGKSNRSHFE